MTPEELVEDMASKAAFDDAYIATMGKAFVDMGIDGLKRFMAKFNDTRTKFTEDQKNNINAVNHALSKNDDFCKAMRAWHEWKETLPPGDFTKELAKAGAAKAEDEP